MKTRISMMLLGITLFMSTGIMAQALYDTNGNKIGKIADGKIWDTFNGRIVARIDGERITDGSGANILNYIRSNGRVMDKTGGNCLGYINSSGRVTDKTGVTTVGFVEGRYVYDKTHGKRIGEHTNADPVYVAYFFFFFPEGQKILAAREKRSMTTKREGIANKVTPAKEKTTKIYNRDRNLMGTLYGNDYFISATKNGIRYDFKKTSEGLTILRQGSYLAHVGKDDKTVYVKHGEKVYGVVDENGNAYLESGEQYGVIKNDGMVYATKSLDMPFGYVGSQDFDRHTVGLLYFVCYYGILHEYYKEVDSKK